jgi:hypothetical protein
MIKILDLEGLAGFGNQITLWRQRTVCWTTAYYLESHRLLRKWEITSKRGKIKLGDLNYHRRLL